MTDKQTLAKSLRYCGADFITHAASRSIGDIEAAGELMLEAARVLAEQPAEQEPVAWSVLDKRTGKHWYTHESRFTSQHYANEYSHREPDGSQSMCVTPLYTAPPDDTALLQQALEALKLSSPHYCGQSDDLLAEERMQHRATIAALRERLGETK